MREFGQWFNQFGDEEKKEEPVASFEVAAIEWNGAMIDEFEDPKGDSKVFIDKFDQMHHAGFPRELVACLEKLGIDPEQFTDIYDAGYEAMQEDMRNPLDLGDLGDDRRLINQPFLNQSNNIQYCYSMFSGKGKSWISEMIGDQAKKCLEKMKEEIKEKSKSIDNLNTDYDRFHLDI
jgi:hypothetical protein